jgi:hypothetical protein
MTTDTHQTSSVPDAPPEASHGEQLSTAEDYKWALKRYTAPQWEIQSVEFETNGHHPDCDATCLSATLQHTGGSLIQVLPFDPLEEEHERTAYTSHRVRCRDQEADDGGGHYITLTGDQVTASHLYNPEATPLADASTRIKKHPQADIHTTERQTGARGFKCTVDTKLAVITAVCGTAHSIHEETHHQTGLQDW